MINDGVSVRSFWKRYHITRNTIIPCHRPVPTSENDPRVLLSVPKDDGSLALYVALGGKKLWYLYTLFTSKRRLNRRRSRIGHSLDSDAWPQTSPGPCSVLRP